jgi:hypothetical protein
MENCENKNHSILQCILRYTFNISPPNLAMFTIYIFFPLKFEFFLFDMTIFCMKFSLVNNEFPSYNICFLFQGSDHVTPKNWWFRNFKKLFDMVP